MQNLSTAFLKYSNLKIKVKIDILQLLLMGQLVGFVFGKLALIFKKINFSYHV